MLIAVVALSSGELMVAEVINKHSNAPDKQALTFLQVDVFVTFIGHLD